MARMYCCRLSRRSGLRRERLPRPYEEDEDELLWAAEPTRAKTEARGMLLPGVVAARVMRRERRVCAAEWTRCVGAIADRKAVDEAAAVRELDCECLAAATLSLMMIKATPYACLSRAFSKQRPAR